MSEENKELPLGLYWKNKRTDVDRIVLPFQSLEVIETINESRATREREKGAMFKEDPAEYLKENEGWRNKLIWGDNKYVMCALLEKFAGKIDLIYIDPPFATGANFTTTVSIGDKEIEHTKEASAIEEVAYRDTWGKGLDSFLQMMYDRLVLMRELLSDKGSIYVHIDTRVNSHVRLIMDEIFGSGNFQNEIIWKRQTSSSSKAVANKLGRNHDCLLYFSKNENKVFNKTYLEYDEDYIEQEFKYSDKKGRYKSAELKTYSEVKFQELKKDNRLIVTSGGKYRYKIYLEEANGVPLDDVWSDVNMVSATATERLDYPTQKPEDLLERIIKTSSNKNDLVVDFFVGSGTTASVAEKLGRRWIAADLGRFAIHTTRKRMLEIDGCKPFEILNVGKYERQYWQTLSFGKKTKEQTLAEYTTFILKLYKAEALPGSSYIHGKKGKQLIHIGSVDAPVTLNDAQMILSETKRMKMKDIVILAWEYEMGFHDTIEQEAAKAGIKLIPLTIPRDVMDKRASDSGDVQFFELAYLETNLKKTSHGFVIELEDFVIPNLDLIPQEVRKLIKKWSDYIDYWSVDWDYKNDTFHNQWQSYRMKKDRSLQLKTDAHEYPKKGIYNAMIKVIDIFGNDTTHIVEIKYI